MENNNLETKLFEAASKGCVTSLHNLLQQDPLLLDRTSASCLSDTPLHVAAMLGHVYFVKEIVSMKPELTVELNPHRSSALHLASAKGRDAVVAALLLVDRSPSLARDRNGLAPVHLAAAKGRVEAMRMLLRAQPGAARLAVYGWGNILHLCVGYGQLEALKVVVESTGGGDPEFVNSRDGSGNTVLHLAVAEKQVETIDFLLTVATLEVNALNLEGMTPMDVLLRSRRDMRDLLIKASLTHAGGHGSLETNIVNNQDGVGARAGAEPSRADNMHKHEWVDRKKDALMVVASLIATMNFQVGVSPPGGVWQDHDKSIDCLGKASPYEPGTSILAHNNPIGYSRFYIFNAIGFVASLSIILLLMSGLPIRRRLFMWVLMAITWVAITATAASYLDAVLHVTPSHHTLHGDRTFSDCVVIAVIVWLGLMALLFVGHTVRLSIKMVRGLVKTLCGRTTGRRPLA